MDALSAIGYDKNHIRKNEKSIGIKDGTELGEANISKNKKNIFKYASIIYLIYFSYMSTVIRIMYCMNF